MQGGGAVGIGAGSARGSPWPGNEGAIGQVPGLEHLRGAALQKQPEIGTECRQANRKGRYKLCPSADNRKRKIFPCETEIQRKIRLLGSPSPWCLMISLPP